MSLKRSSAGGRSSFGTGGDPGAKVGRQELFDELQKLAKTGQGFTPVDVALSIGAGEPQVSRALLGLAAEGCLEKLEPGKYQATPFLEMTQAEFLKAFARASKMDSTRQRDLSEIGRLKQNNDIMRGKLLAAIAERDHFQEALRRHGIDAGPVPAPAPVVSAPASDEVTAPAAVPADLGGSGANVGAADASSSGESLAATDETAASRP